MADNRFSLRTRVAAPGGGLIFDDVPPGVVNGFCNYITRLDAAHLDELYALVCERLDVLYSADDAWSPQYPSLTRASIENIIGEGWYRFYDICEIVGEFIGDGGDEYQNTLNNILRRNFVGYELRDGKIERAGASAADAVVAEARGILRNPRFQGPNDQFLKAVGFYSQRPEPDEENCVKEAVGAVEGVARILLQNDSILLSDAAKELVKRGKVPVTLRKVFDGIYAYRGDAEGVGHGRTGAPEVSIEHAELVLNSSAALIVYLARLYGIEVVT